MTHRVSITLLGGIYIVTVIDYTLSLLAIDNIPEHPAHDGRLCKADDLH